MMNHDVIKTWVKGTFEVRGKPDFNATEYKGFVDKVLAFIL